MVLRTFIVRNSIFKRPLQSLEPITIHRYGLQHREKSSYRVKPGSLPIFTMPTIASNYRQTIFNTAQISRLKSDDCNEESDNHLDTIDDETIESMSNDDIQQFFEGHRGDRNIKQVKVTSLRFDTIASKAFGIPKNKIETLFFESKIRIDGKKIVKKSRRIGVNNEIDIIKGFSTDNPDFLIVDRIEILLIQYDRRTKRVIITLRLSRSLAIENYETALFKAIEEPSEL